MNKTFGFAIVTAALTAASLATAEVQFLRGDQGIDAMATAPAKTTLQEVEGGFKRSFEDQPPLVPHKVDKYKVSLTENKCMDCHSEENYKEEDAPRVADSHYLDRDGKKLDKLAGSRYFCGQCHVPQVDAKPLVENTFQAAVK